MTIKTVYGNGCIGMATITKMSFVFVIYGLLVFVLNHMAIDAFLETVLGGAYAFVHSVIPLMQYEVHMIPAHYIGWFHAFFSIAFGNLGMGHPRFRAGNVADQQKGNHCSY